MRAAIVLAIAVSILLAFAVACGDDDNDTQVIPSPANGSEGEAEEREEADVPGVGEESEEGEAEDGGEEDGGAEDGDGADGGEPAVDCAGADADGDTACDDDDLCPDTAAGSVVDDVGCSDAQVDHDNDAICDPAAVSDGPSDCDLIDDNCPLLANPAQDDYDGDLEGDACDVDDDDDGVRDDAETGYGSDPLNDASRPEGIRWVGTCSDGVDNDLDGDIDDADDGCAE